MDAGWSLEFRVGRQPEDRLDVHDGLLLPADIFFDGDDVPVQEYRSANLESRERGGPFLVVPKPAGAETRVSPRPASGASLSTRRGRETSFGRDCDGRSLVETSGSTASPTWPSRSRFYPPSNSGRAVRRHVAVERGPDDAGPSSRSHKRSATPCSASGSSGDPTPPSTPS